jgi:hypothetical protein
MRADSNALEQIDRRDHSAALSGLFGEARERGAGARTPEPRRIGFIKPLFRAFDVDRVVVEQFKAALHHVPQHLVLRQICADHFAEVVVGLAEVKHLAA